MAEVTENVQPVSSSIFCVEIIDVLLPAIVRGGGGLREGSVVNCAVLRVQEEMIIAFSTRISSRLGVGKLKWGLGEERRQ
jgi:hypothetical protein